MHWMDQNTWGSDVLTPMYVLLISVLCSESSTFSGIGLTAKNLPTDGLVLAEQTLFGRENIYLMSIQFRTGNGGFVMTVNTFLYWMCYCVTGNGRCYCVNN